MNNLGIIQLLALSEVNIGLSEQSYYNDTPSKAGIREWIGLAVLALPTLLLSIDLSVLHLALPHLSADLGAKGTELLWITDIYGFMIAGFLITMGSLGDRIGRRKLLIIGGAAFGIASILAAYSTSPAMLIVTRGLMGIAGATLMPSTLSLISNLFCDPRQRGMAIAVWMSCFMGGMAIGPVVGGAFIEWFWWGAVFLLGVPVMTLLLVTAPFLLPESRNSECGRLDLLSAVLLLVSVLPVIYGIKELARHGWQIAPLVLIIIGLGFGIVFCFRQFRLIEPLLDLRLFRHRTFSAALLISMSVGAIQGGILFLFNLHLQLVEGLSPINAGLWLIPSSLAMIAATLSVPLLVRRIRPAYVITTGLSISAIGYFILSQLDIGSGLAAAILGIILVMTGVGPMGALATELIIGSVPNEKAGAAAAVSESGSEFGIAFGVAVLGSLGTAVYRNSIVVPADIPIQSAETVNESIVGAVSVAEEIRTPLAAEMLSSAREAFLLGLNVSALVSSLIYIALALASIYFLRHVLPSGDMEDTLAKKIQDTQAKV